MDAPASTVGGQGAGDQEIHHAVTEARTAALLGTRRHRDHPQARLLVGRRRYDPRSRSPRIPAGGRLRVQDAAARLSGYSHAVLVVADESGYPLSVATSFKVVDGTIEATPVSALPSVIRDTEEARLVVSHIRPYPGVGYDQRRYIELSGSLSVGGPAWRFTPRAARGWDEEQLSFPELCQRAIPQARHYLAALTAERGRKVKPQMAIGWRFFLATRLPFLSATIIPVFLGLAAAAYDGRFSLGLALLTLLGAGAVHLGLNVANDIFDTLSGVDDANFTPTQFSGGSRVLQYGLVSLRQMMGLAAAFYATAVVIGLVLVAVRGAGLLWLGLAGVLISYFYTAPPLRLVHRGLGELCVALGFGPIMVLGTYFVQTGRYAVRPLVLSIPVAILVMLILYANEVPDRVADGRAGKRTLVVRFSPAWVLRGYAASAAAAYLVVVAGVISGVLPWPTLAALATIPIALRVLRGLREHFDSPYQLMPYLGKNVTLHLYTGLLLVAGTLAGIPFRR
ncbi:MAG: prenyltransferase [Chloroflexi bacterium]|nr:MAG: prenyltransferase [Chloroflexota bacterium]